MFLHNCMQVFAISSIRLQSAGAQRRVQSVATGNKLIEVAKLLVGRGPHQRIPSLEHSHVLG